MSHESLEREEDVEGFSNRSFGIVFAVAFSVISLFPLLHEGPVRVWSFVVGGVFLLLALAVPDVLAPLARLWLKLGLLLGKIVSPIALGIVFYGVVTPIGLVMKMLGKDILKLRTDKQAATYWVEREPPGPTAESLKDQF